MLTIEQLEAQCVGSQPVQFPKHVMDPPELTYRMMYFPFGFPVEVRTNSIAVLKQVDAIWGKFYQQRETEPIRYELYLVEGSSTECPPEPSYRYLHPFMVCTADADNYSVVDLEGRYARAVISQAALNHPLYAQYFLLGTPCTCISTAFVTPIHAGCVALDGRGVLLCGDSGAGKSTLSYACARAGWTYVSDDGSYLLNGGTQRLVTGDCHKVRFRPTAAALFPEIEGLEITPRAAGKPSIELQTAPMAHIQCAQTTRVDFIVFLNRRSGGRQELVPYSREVARQFMRQVPYGPRKSVAAQYEAIDRLLTQEVFELRYSELDPAIDRLRELVMKGR